MTDESTLPPFVATRTNVYDCSECGRQTVGDLYCANPDCDEPDPVKLLLDIWQYDFRKPGGILPAAMRHRLERTMEKHGGWNR